MTLSTRFQNAIRALRGAEAYNLSELESLIRQGETSSERIDAETVKNCSTVFSCVRLLSDAIASLPLKLYSADDKQRTLAKDNPLYSVLSSAPCPWMDKFAYWKFNINCLLLRGMFASEIVRNSKGNVIQLNPINPANIRMDDIELNSLGELVFKVTLKNGGTKTYTSSNLFFCYYETLDGIKPVSPLTFAAQTVGLAKNAEKYGIDTLRKGAVLPGYYTSDKALSDTAYARIKEDLGKHGIGDNSGRAPLLEEGLKYNTVSMTAEDMQMLETRRYQKEEICGMFAVPPHMIGDVAQAKGWSTMEQSMTEFLQLSLMPLITRVENAASTRLIQKDPSLYVKFSVDGLLRGDLTARTNYYRNMAQNGAMSPNEIREKEEMNPIEGGDKYYIPANMTETNKIGAKNEL